MREDPWTPSASCARCRPRCGTARSSTCAACGASWNGSCPTSTPSSCWARRARTRPCVTGCAWRLVEEATAAIAGRRPVWVGIGEAGTERAIEAARRVAPFGPDALVACGPYYFGAATQADLLTHHRRIADAVTAPVFLYDIPQLTGLALEPATVAALAEHPNVIGIKDSSGDFIRFQASLAAAGPGFLAYVGREDLLAAALWLGGTGVVSALAAVGPRLLRALIDGGPGRRPGRGHGALQAEVSRAARVFFVAHPVASLKMALAAQGLIEPADRRPHERIRPTDDGARPRAPRGERAADDRGGSDSDDRPLAGSPASSTRSSWSPTSTRRCTSIATCWASRSPCAGSTTRPSSRTDRLSRGHRGGGHPRGARRHGDRARRLQPSAGPPARREALGGRRPELHHADLRRPGRGGGRGCGPPARASWATSSTTSWTTGAREGRVLLRARGHDDHPHPDAPGSRATGLTGPAARRAP